MNLYFGDVALALVYKWMIPKNHSDLNEWLY